MWIALLLKCTMSLHMHISPWRRKVSGSVLRVSDCKMLLPSTILCRTLLNLGCSLCRMTSLFQSSSLLASQRLLWQGRWTLMVWVDMLGMKEKHETFCVSHMKTNKISLRIISGKNLFKDEGLRSCTSCTAQHKRIPPSLLGGASRSQGGRSWL